MLPRPAVASSPLSSNAALDYATLAKSAPIFFAIPSPPHWARLDSNIPRWRYRKLRFRKSRVRRTTHRAHTTPTWPK